MLPVAILAGGLATRLGNITRDIPKSLIEINNKPFIYWQLSLLKKSNFEKIVICVSHKSEMIKNYVGDGEKFNLKIEYSEDGPFRLGTGGAIKKALNKLGNQFMVLYGDSYLDVDYKKISQFFKDSAKPALMTVYKNLNKYDKSNVIFSQNEIKKYLKGTNDPNFKHIDFGLNFFKSEVFAEYPHCKEFDLSKVCSKLANDGNLAGYEVLTRFYEIGSKNGISELNQYLKERSDVIQSNTFN